jgi:hypothetical protein
MNECFEYCRSVSADAGGGERACGEQMSVGRMAAGSARSNGRHLELVALDESSGAELFWLK